MPCRIGLFGRQSLLNGLTPVHLRIHCRVGQYVALGKSIPTILTCLFFSSAYAQESVGMERLIDVYYRYEVVAGYCGLTTDSVVEGYVLERKQIVAEFLLDKAQQLVASGKASQRAHNEWLNRSLGGFKGWCRNEGQGYANKFVILDQLEHGQ